MMGSNLMRTWVLSMMMVAACDGTSRDAPDAGTSDGPGRDPGTDAGAPDGPAPDGGPTATVKLDITAGGQTLDAVTFDAADDQTIEITNHGTVASTPLVITITGSGAEDVVIDASSTCAGQRLSPNQGCTIVLHYRPLTDEVRAAALNLIALPSVATAIPLTPVGKAAVRIVFAGDGLGEVQVDSDLGTLATCTATCRIRAAAGESLTLIPSSPSVFGGLTGACSNPVGGCQLTTTSATQVVTATFTRPPREVWTRLLGGSQIMSAAYDRSGNLVVAADQITKLSPTGATIWQVALAVCSVAIGPNGTVYAQTATELHKLTAAGGPVWTVPLDPRAVGCARDDDAGFDGFLHNLAVGSDGAVAVHGDTGVARWAANGAFSWSAALDSGGRYGVVIDAAGVVGAAIQSANGETTDLARFSATGARLVDQEGIAGQYHGMMVMSPGGQLLVTSSGHSHVDALGHSVQLLDPDFVPNGICAAGNDAAWLYEPDDNSQLARVYTLDRYRADNQLASSFTSAPAQSPPFGDLLGTAPHDIAGALNGRVAVVGAYVTTLRRQGWITVFAP